MKTNTRHKIDTTYKKPKKKRRPIFYFFVIIFSVSFIVLWFVLTFFKVRSIEIIGENPYEKNQIIDLCDISLGDSIFEIDMEKMSRSVENNLTMIESVKVSHKLFGTILLELEKATPMLVSQRSDKTYILLSDKLKILKMGLLIPPPDVAVLEGVALIDPVEGEYGEFSLEEEKKEEALVEILFYLKSHELFGVNKIDMTNHLDIVLEYNNQVGIKLGTRSRMDMKIKDIKYLIDEKISNLSSATIDASLLESQTKPNIRYQIIGSLDEFYNISNEDFFKDQNPDETEGEESEKTEKEESKIE